ncbi:sulfite oxidase heme-binding subunit YedZ [Roseibium sp.]|uniref:sulfite oxidase heme-binding subunit YedZ n=1 Tax=Roseibium sp. TaxID=1936156 RepID=UPI003A97EC02
MANASEILALYAPWTDRRGVLSIPRLLVFLALLAPSVALVWDLAFGPIRPEPFEQALHESGEWAVRFLLVSLAITPLRNIFRLNRLVGYRRMIGVSVLGYGLFHLGLYMAQENWDPAKIVSEIALRFYLTIGFVGLIGLVILGATSFDSAIRKLGPNWNRLHALVYPIAVLALWHHFLQSKSDVTLPTLMAGLFALLMIYRIAKRFRLDLASPLLLIACAILGAAATAGVEYAWYSLATGIPAELVFKANFDVATSLRPTVWVGIAGLGVALLSAAQHGYSRVVGRAARA